MELACDNYRSLSPAAPAFPPGFLSRPSGMSAAPSKCIYHLQVVLIPDETSLWFTASFEIEANPAITLMDPE